MKLTYRLLVAAVAMLVLVLMLGSAGQSKTVNAQQATPTGTVDTSSELPADAKMLTFDKPITETLDPNTTIKFYTFTGKAQQEIRVDMEPKSGDFFTTLTIMTTDLQTIIGGTLGEDMVSGSLVVRLPADGQYAVSVEYDSPNGTAVPAGSYQLTLSNFTVK